MCINFIVSSIGKQSSLVFVAAIILLITAAARASSVVPVDIEQMSLKAGKIFHGRCIDAKAVQDKKGIDSTLVTYEVLRGVKGEPSSTVTFKVFGSSSFAAGSEDVLFLYEESPWGFTSPIGLWQGSFSVVQSEDGPRLSRKSRAYQETFGTGMKAASVSSSITGGRRIATPDDLLDEVETILGQQ